ncbi:MAG: hypothetical protein R3C45_08240 [Phycisphaerales bacterium]
MVENLWIWDCLEELAGCGRKRQIQSLPVIKTINQKNFTLFSILPILTLGKGYSFVNIGRILSREMTGMPGWARQAALDQARSRDPNRRIDANAAENDHFDRA